MFSTVVYHGSLPIGTVRWDWGKVYQSFGIVRHTGENNTDLPLGEFVSLDAAIAEIFKWDERENA